MDLFSMFLKNAFGWGVGKILDVVIKCFFCGDKNSQRIGNFQHNDLYCPNCHKTNNQFTNACDFTINKQNLEIGQGLVVPADKKWGWETEGGFFENKTEWLTIPHFIRLVGFQGRDVVLRTEIRSYNTNNLITAHASVLSPSYYNSYWDRKTHMFQDGNFKEVNEKILAVDSILMSEYRDIICKDRRIITPWK